MRLLAAGDSYISLAGRWHLSMLKQWNDKMLFSARCGSRGLPPVSSNPPAVCETGFLIAGFAVRLMAVIMLPVKPKRLYSLLFLLRVMPDVMERRRC